MNEQFPWGALLIFAVYFALMRWVLPSMGVPT